jgi:hypothetical protein
MRIAQQADRSMAALVQPPPKHSLAAEGCEDDGCPTRCAVMALCALTILCDVEPRFFTGGLRR